MGFAKCFGLNFANSADFADFDFADFANFALAKCRQVECLVLNFGFASFVNSGFGLNFGLNSALNSNFGLNSACFALNLGFLSYQQAKRLDFERHLLAKRLALNFALNLDFG